MVNVNDCWKMRNGEFRKVVSIFYNNYYGSMEYQTELITEEEYNTWKQSKK